MESFPQILQSLDGAKCYVDAFRAPLQGLTMMKAQQVHALRACSLVVIAPSEERTPPLGGFPRDLSGMNLTSWAGLIQDVAQGMNVVPPNLSMEVFLDSMVLLQLLEATTGIGYCRICCQPSPQCCCLGAYQPALTETWSQMMARMPGQGVAASTGGPTTPGTATAEVQEQGAPSPSPSLHPLDFTNWSLPLPEAPLTEGLPAPSGGLPGIRRQTVGPTGPRSTGPGTAYAGAKCSPGNAAGPSAKATPPCYSLPAGSAATEPACYSVPAGCAATEPACYSVPAGCAATEPACYSIPVGCAATQEASGEGRGSPTPLQQSHSCSWSNHPQPRKAAGQGTGHQRQISQSPRAWARDSNQCSLNYHTRSHTTPTRPLCKAQALRPSCASIEVLQWQVEEGP